MICNVLLPKQGSPSLSFCDLPFGAFSVSYHHLRVRCLFWGNSADTYHSTYLEKDGRAECLERTQEPRNSLQCHGSSSCSVESEVKWSKEEKKEGGRERILLPSSALGKSIFLPFSSSLLLLLR